MMKFKYLVNQPSRTELMPSEDEKCTSENEVQKFPQFLAAGLATLMACAMGLCLSWTSAAIPMLNQVKSEYNLTPNQGAWVGSLFNLGAFTGALPTGKIVQMIGRKTTLQALSIPLCVSWIIIACSPGVIPLYSARFLAGLASGAISVAAPMYVAEIAHSSIRGTLGTFFQIQITIGLLIEYILGATVTNFTLLALLSSVIILVFLVGFSFMPESPVYLFSKNDFQGARESLRWLRGQNYTIEEELLKLKTNLQEAQTNRAKLSDLTNCRATLKGCIIVLGLMLIQQFSGINAVLFYDARIFAEAGSNWSPNFCSIIIGTVQVLATFGSTALIDKAGRKILLLISASIMCVSIAALAVYFRISTVMELPVEFKVVPLVCLCSFVIVFSIGFGPIPWMIVGEIVDPKVKGLLSSMVAAVSWMSAFIVTNQFENISKCIGMSGAFGVFAFICGIGGVFVYTLVPETKGRDIEQVKDFLRGEKLNVTMTVNNSTSATSSV